MNKNWFAQANCYFSRPDEPLRTRPHRLQPPASHPDPTGATRLHDVLHRLAADHSPTGSRQRIALQHREADRHEDHTDNHVVAGNFLGYFFKIFVF